MSTRPWLDGRRPWLAALAVLLLAGLVRALHLDYPAYVDELYHLLAARNWLTDGELRIADGLYTRAEGYTMLNAWAFALFGDSVPVARAIPVLFGSLLVLALFVWTRSVAGTLAAWLAALLLCFAPDAIMVSRFARFYALHGVLFFLGAVGVYALVEQRPALRAALPIALGSATCFVLALHLQVITVIGLFGILLWIGLVVVLPWLVATYRTSGRSGRALIVGACVAGAAIVVLVLGSEHAARQYERLRGVPPWAAATKDAFWYYHVAFSAQYGSLWPLMPLAVLIGLARRPRPTLFCLTLFTPALIVHSIGAMKSMRYLYYVLPFLFTIFGIAFAAVSRGLQQFVRDTGGQAMAALGLRPPPRLVEQALPAAVLLFVLVSNEAFIRAAGMAIGLERFMPVQDMPRWEAARPGLEPWLEKADVVLTSSELEALFYLGRYDVLISRSRAAEIDDYQEFSRDHRTGRPVITTVASLELLIDCHADGLIVTPARLWRASPHIGDPLADVILKRTTPLELPSGTRVDAFVWDRPAAPADDRCTTVRELVGSASGPPADQASAARTAAVIRAWPASPR